MSTTKRKNLTIVLSLVLVAAIAIGGTLAYLFTKTDPVNNVFTFAENIKGELSEPSWIPEDALNLTPGKEIPKDPQIKNTSENGVVEYGAIKLTFLDGSGNEVSAADMITLLNLIGIDWSNSWTLKNGTLTKDGTGKVTAASAQQIYVFDNTIPQGVTTDPIFYSVDIPANITPDQLKWLLGDYGHDENACYEAGTHNGDVCTITYRHHEKCALFDGVNTTAAISGVKKGGALGGKTCDCNAVDVHDALCPLLIKTLKGDCAHTTVVSGLGNFTIKVEGAVVQADAFDTFNDAVTALISLF